MISQGRIVTKFHGVAINMFIEFIEILWVQFFFVLGDVVIVRTERHVRNHPGHSSFFGFGAFLYSVS